MSNRRTRILAVLVAATVCAACGRFAGRRVAPAPAHLTHGVAVGEIGATSAIVWARCDQVTTLHVALDGASPPRDANVVAEHDFVGKVAFDGLAAATAYRARAWCGDSVTVAAEATFRTAPDPSEPARVRMLWGGDVGGQNVCRDAAEGYPIFERMRERQADFFVALGDMIYADDACAAIGRFGNAQVVGPSPASTAVPSFWEHWRYNRADPATQRFFTTTPYYAVWDDHEIENDAGPRNQTRPDAPAEPRLAAARAAYVDYQPLVHAEKLYRSARWGRHLEIFFLDTRSYRQANADPDAGSYPKTMLGDEQRRWLIDGLVRSKATWKVIVSSVPLSIPTGGDGWADGGTRQGFERELVAIFTGLRAVQVRNLVWLTTDVHFATGFRSTPFPGFRLLELTSGPLSAGFFPRQDLDPTLHPERLYFHGPATPPASFAEARGYFNFGELEVERDGGLVVRIVTTEGSVPFERRFRPNS